MRSGNRGLPVAQSWDVNDALFVWGKMGLKRLADRLKVDPKKLKKQEMPCFTELMRFFGALQKVGYDADKCQAEKVALQEAINEMVSVGVVRLSGGSTGGHLSIHLQC